MCGERTSAVLSSNGTDMGDRSSQTNCGWEIDHIKPDSKGGEDIVSNARPLQWYNNATRSNGRLTCPISAKEDK